MSDEHDVTVRFRTKNNPLAVGSTWTMHGLWHEYDYENPSVTVIAVEPVKPPMTPEAFVARVRGRLPQSTLELSKGTPYADLVTDLRNLLTEHDRGRP